MGCYLAVIMLSVLPERVLRGICPLVKHKHVVAGVEQGISLHQLGFGDLVAVVAFVVISAKTRLGSHPAHCYTTNKK
jgi:hypothetical protein